MVAFEKTSGTKKEKTRVGIKGSVPGKKDEAAFLLILELCVAPQKTIALGHSHDRSK